MPHARRHRACRAQGRESRHHDTYDDVIPFFGHAMPARTSSPGIEILLKGVFWMDELFHITFLREEEEKENTPANYLGISSKIRFVFSTVTL